MTRYLGAMSASQNGVRADQIRELTRVDAIEYLLGAGKDISTLLVQPTGKLDYQIIGKRTNEDVWKEIIEGLDNETIGAIFAYNPDYQATSWPYKKALHLKYGVASSDVRWLSRGLGEQALDHFRQTLN